MEEALGVGEGELENGRWHRGEKVNFNLPESFLRELVGKMLMPSPLVWELLRKEESLAKRGKKSGGKKGGGC